MINIRLRQLMNERGLTRRETASLISVPHRTLDGWLAPENSPSFRAMPAPMLELLELKLESMMKTYDVFVNVKEDGNDIWATDLAYEEARKAVEDARKELGSCCINAWMEPVSAKRRREIESGF